MVDAQSSNNWAGIMGNNELAPANNGIVTAEDLSQTSTLKKLSNNLTI